MAAWGDPCAEAAQEDEELDVLARRFAHRVGFFVDRIAWRYRIAGCWRDDLVSAGFWGLLQALRNRRRGADPRELSAYVSLRVEGAILDEARVVLRHRKRIEALEGADGDETGDPADAFVCPREGPERATARRGRRLQVWRAIEPLATLERRVLLAYAEGSTLAEIASREGVAVATLHQRWTRTTRSLRAPGHGLRAVLEETRET